MDRTITIRGKAIHLRLELHAMHITYNNELAVLLLNDAEAATDELITTMKGDYYQLFDTNFDVSEASIAVEIWGHVYGDTFADWIKNLSPIALIDKIAEKISYHCEIINIGEPGYDDNRFFWDRLAIFKSAIAKFLP